MLICLCNEEYMYQCTRCLCIYKLNSDTLLFDRYDQSKKNDVNALSIRNDSDNDLFAICKPILSGQGNVEWGFSTSLVLFGKLDNGIFSYRKIL